MSIRTPDGDEVMFGDVPDPVVKPGDVGKVACCVPDDDGGSECEERGQRRASTGGVAITGDQPRGDRERNGEHE